MHGVYNKVIAKSRLPLQIRVTSDPVAAESPKANLRATWSPKLNNACVGMRATMMHDVRTFYEHVVPILASCDSILQELPKASPCAISVGPPKAGSTNLSINLFHLLGILILSTILLPPRLPKAHPGGEFDLKAEGIAFQRDAGMFEQQVTQATSQS